MGKQVKTKQPKTNFQKRQATRINNEEVRKLLLPDKSTIAKQKKNIKPMHKQKLRLVLKQDLMNCPICLETMLNPAITVCGHCFCLACIQQHFFRSTIDQDDPSCPSCRNPLNFYDCHQSNQLRAMIDYYNANFGKEEEMTRYKQRRLEFQQQEERRNFKVEELEQGIKADYFNNHYSKWQVGEIFEKIINEQEVVLVLKIKAEPGCILSHTHYQINAKSRLLARHTFFTKRYEQASNSWQEETIDNIIEAHEGEQRDDDGQDDQDENDSDDNDEQDSDAEQQPADNDNEEEGFGNNEHVLSVNVQDKRNHESDSDQQDQSSNSGISINY